MSHVAEAKWEAQQKKTFTKWMNTRLAKIGVAAVGDLFEDGKTGIPFVHLLRALGKAVPRHNEAPRSRISMMENVTIVLEAIKAQGIPLVNIGSPDIVDGDQKLILGLIWTIISRMSMSEVMDDTLFSLREELLEWVQRVTDSYENVSVKNFTTSWKDGLAFNALIHRFRPETMAYEDLGPSDARFNMEQAFSIAESKLEIPRLLDAEDIVDAVVPDEKSIMTYISEFYKKFKSEEQRINNRNTIGVFLRGLEWSLSVRSQYEARARTLLQAKGELGEKIAMIAKQHARLCDLVGECERVNSSLITESVDLHLMLNNIQDTDRLFNLRLYTPPAELSLESIGVSYQRVQVDNELLKRQTEAFENGDAAEVERARDVCTEFFRIADKSDQISRLQGTKQRLGRFAAESESKRELLDNFRRFVEDKEAKLQKFVEIGRNREWLIASAQKMFRLADARGSGSITQSDCRKILKTLRLNAGDAPKPIRDPVTLEVLLEAVCGIYSPVARPAQIRRAFEELGADGYVDVKETAPGNVFKHIPLSNGNMISYADLQENVDD